MRRGARADRRLPGPDARLVVELSEILVMVAFLAVRVAAGIAILRYRLYDIDVIIRRTLVCVALTAILAGVYVSAILVLQAVLRPVTGEEALAAAVSTLAVAALFQPARRRVQALVDRRFYRGRYHAARTLDAFSAELRHEVDLDEIASDIANAVERTLASATVSVWLPSGGDRA